MAFFISRGVQKSLQIGGMILGLAAILGLIHHGRFAAYKYDVIDQDGILPSLLKTVVKGDEPTCSIDLKTLSSVDINDLLRKNVNLTDHDVANLYHVNPGGSWTPPHCRPTVRVFLLIPFRNRANHLKQFLRVIHPFLQAQNVSYTILVAEQDGEEAFNRAKLFNAGYQELKKSHGSLGCLIFHDVDLIPLDGRNVYGCVNGPRALHLSAHLENFRYNLPYHDLFGGAVALDESIFEEVNGFSNNFFGWGGEDDNLSHRLHSSGYSIVRYDPSISRYSMLRHRKEAAATRTSRNSDDSKSVEASQHVEVDPDQNDGVRQVEYSVVESTLKPLYTHVILKL